MTVLSEERGQKVGGKWPVEMPFLSNSDHFCHFNKSINDVKIEAIYRREVTLLTGNLMRGRRDSNPQLLA